MYLMRYIILCFFPEGHKNRFTCAISSDIYMLPFNNSLTKSQSLCFVEGKMKTNTPSTT